MPEKDKEKGRVRVQVVEEPVHAENAEPEEHEEEHHELKHPEEHEGHKHHEDHEHEEHEEELKTPIPSLPQQDKIPFWILFFAFLIGLTLGAGLIGGIFYYRSKVGNLPIITTKKQEVTVNETSTPTPTVVAEEKLDLSKYSVQILNGSGIAGEAGRVETILKNAGFTNTKVGNAGSYDFTSTEVAIKKDLPTALFDEIKKDLSAYQIKQVDPPESSSSYDIIITVGKTKS